MRMTSKKLRFPHDIDRRVHEKAAELGVTPAAIYEVALQMGIDLIEKVHPDRK